MEKIPAKETPHSLDDPTPIADELSDQRKSGEMPPELVSTTSCVFVKVFRRSDLRFHEIKRSQPSGVVADDDIPKHARAFTRGEPEVPGVHAFRRNSMRGVRDVNVDAPPPGKNLALHESRAVI